MKEHPDVLVTAEVYQKNLTGLFNDRLYVTLNQHPEELLKEIVPGRKNMLITNGQPEVQTMLRLCNQFWHDIQMAIKGGRFEVLKIEALRWPTAFFFYFKTMNDICFASPLVYCHNADYGMIYSILVLYFEDYLSQVTYCRQLIVDLDESISILDVKHVILDYILIT